jgi:hypothetical protein
VVYPDQIALASERRYHGKSGLMNDPVDEHSLIFFCRPATVFVVRQKSARIGDVHDGVEQLSG